MHKKLSAELTSLAHSILQMKNKENVFLLQKKAHEIYEKLSVLAYIEEYVNSTPQATETKEELLAKVEEIEKRKKVVLHEEKIEKEKVEENELQTSNFTSEVVDEEIDEVKNEVQEDISTQVVEEIIEQPFDELEETIFGDDDNAKFDETSFIEEAKIPTLEDELKDTISVDVTADLFTKLEPKKSLNDKLQNTIQIGLNDRIAFVKHLFNNDSAGFNRVVSQLNTFDTEKEAKKFINKTVKPDYDWSDKEEYENRFLEIVERRFA